MFKYLDSYKKVRISPDYYKSDFSITFDCCKKI